MNQVPQQIDIDVTFHNVTITVSASDSAEAYSRLCDALSSIECEFVTDTYSTETTSEAETCQLWLFAEEPS